jgi:hypothetical protein
VINLTSGRFEWDKLDTYTAIALRQKNVAAGLPISEDDPAFPQYLESLRAEQAQIEVPLIQDWDFLLSLFSASAISAIALGTNDGFVSDRLAQITSSFLLRNIDQLVDNYRQMAARLIELGLISSEQANFVPQLEQAGFALPS